MLFEKKTMQNNEAEINSDCFNRNKLERRAIFSRQFYPKTEVGYFSIIKKSSTFLKNESSENHFKNHTIHFPSQ